MNSSSEKTAILLIDHGSKVATANELLERIGELLAAGGAYEIVEIAHMELAEPTIEQAFERCVKRGAERVVIVPYFLAQGRHAGSDIPRMAAEAAEAHPQLKWAMAEPLGLDERLVRLVEDRAAAAAREAWDEDGER